MERITAPMPGTVISVDVQAGQDLEAGTLILILEAMKMHNEIFCTDGGTVREVLVNKGDFVKANDVMVVIA